MLTELPEKWCFTSTKESVDIIKKWRIEETKNENFDYSIGNHYCSDNGSVQGWMHFAPERKKGYIELTFEEFKRLVLKESLTQELIVW
jgi:hypothetical protein